MLHEWDVDLKKVTRQLALHHFGRQFPLNHLKRLSPQCRSKFRLKIDTQHNRFAFCVLLVAYFKASELRLPAVYSLGPTSIKLRHVQLQLAHPEQLVHFAQSI